MPRTTADVPPVIAADYARARRPEAIAEADGDGYVKTRPMKKAQQPGKSSKQYGLPKSTGVKVMKMKG
jgi:hypothetical protein